MYFYYLSLKKVLESTGKGEENQNPAQCYNQTIDDTAFEARSCDLSINGAHWQEVKNSSVYPAFTNVMVSNEVRYKLQLSTARNKDHSIWSFYELYPISVSDLFTNILPSNLG